MDCKRLVVALVLSAVSCAGVAQVLWRDSRYGMSVDDVRSVNPAAIAPPTPANVATGAMGLLELPGVELAGAPFTARFFFIDDKLQQVTLELDSAHATANGAAIHQALDARFTASFGDDTRRAWGNGLNTVSWHSGQTSITLFSMAFDGKAQLRVVYQPRHSREGGNP